MQAALRQFINEVMIRTNAVAAAGFPISNCKVYSVRTLLSQTDMCVNTNMGVQRKMDVRAAYCSSAAEPCQCHAAKLRHLAHLLPCLRNIPFAQHQLRKALACMYSSAINVSLSYLNLLVYFNTSLQIDCYMLQTACRTCFACLLSL